MVPLTSSYNACYRNYHSGAKAWSCDHQIVCRFITRRAQMLDRVIIKAPKKHLGLLDEWIVYRTTQLCIAQLWHRTHTIFL
jgi:hypothetical protein